MKLAAAILVAVFFGVVIGCHNRANVNIIVVGGKLSQSEKYFLLEQGLKDGNTEIIIMHISGKAPTSVLDYKRVSGNRRIQIKNANIRASSERHENNFFIITENEIFHGRVDWGEIVRLGIINGVDKKGIDQFSKEFKLTPIERKE